MPILLDLASFPNSRIKVRPVASQGDTQIVQIAAGPGPTTQLLAADANRTNILIRNLSSADTIWFGYENNVDDQVGATGGLPISPLQSLVVDVPEVANYVYNPSGNTIDLAVEIGLG